MTNMPRLTVESKIIPLNKIFLIVIILILLVSNVYFGFKYFGIQKELQEKTDTLETQKTNEKILNFTDLFIKKVLKAENEINFETRLQLENAVRDINDEKVLSQWQKFTESENETKAQEEVKNLLEILVSKIKK
jgi:hypothetical protein